MSKKSSAWQKNNRAVRAACNEYGIDDETRRGLVKLVTGKDSLSDCLAGEVSNVLKRINEMNGRAEKKTRKRQNFSTNASMAGSQKKLLALWLVLYDFAIVDSNQDAALNAFIKRQTGIEMLQWLKPADADKVIRSLKTMLNERLKRHNLSIFWAEFRSFHPARAVIEAQFRLLVKVGALPDSIHVDCEDYAAHTTGINRGFKLYNDTDFQNVQKAWGKWLRKLKASGKLW